MKYTTMANTITAVFEASSLKMYEALKAKMPKAPEETPVIEEQTPVDDKIDKNDLERMKYHLKASRLRQIKSKIIDDK